MKRRSKRGVSPTPENRWRHDFTVKLSASPQYWKSIGIARRDPRVKPEFVSVHDIEEAAAVCLDFMYLRGLLAGEWTGGQVYLGGRVVALVDRFGHVTDELGRTPVSIYDVVDRLYEPIMEVYNG
jgi:hypothetical protein